MKKLCSTIILIIIAISIVHSQTQTFKYQAVLRDNNGNILANKNVGVKITIIQGAPATAVSSEEFNQSSDEFGVVNLEIGTGTAPSVSYQTIDWSKGNNQLRVDIDITGGRNFSLLGTSLILSVPVANYASKAGVASSAGFPAGMIIAFAGDTSKIPSGWLLCNGKAINRVNYATLFQTIGVSWGSGDIINTFNLPDLRGQFLRGTDLGAGNDPDVVGRTLKNSATWSNSKVGSYQGDVYLSHNHGGGNHTHSQQTNFANGGTLSAWGFSFSQQMNCLTDNNIHQIINKSGDIITSNGGNETRPKNAYVNYIIKY